MFVPIAIILVLLLSIVAIALWFYNEKYAMVRIHSQTISDLEASICTHRHQINLRNTNLNRYDFQQFNLDESLIVQREIKL